MSSTCNHPLPPPLYNTGNPAERRHSPELDCNLLLNTSCASLSFLEQYIGETQPKGKFDIFMALAYYLSKRGIVIGSFIPLAEFKALVDQLIKDLKASERIEGVEEISLPGERGFRIKKERLKAGIP